MPIWRPLRTEPPDAELETEEEQQEDDAEMGDEVSHFGLLDQVSSVGSFGPSSRPASR